jgi:regulator of cell morphogenesis and NO signaling
MKEIPVTAIDAQSRLGDIVTKHPMLARDLERLDLDYCCGGRQTIAQACDRHGLDVAMVLADLEAAELAARPAPPEPWSTMGVVQLVDHIEAAHHQYLWSELPRLTVLADKVLGVHGGRHPELEDVHACLRDIRADLEPHMRK